MAEYAGIVFDKDGTLIDFDATWGPATCVLFKSLSRTPAQFAALAQASGLDPVAQRLQSDSPIVGDDLDSLIALWSPLLPQHERAELRAAVLARYGPASLRSLTPLPGTETVLRALSARWPLAVATNDSSDNARAQLAQLGWAPLFSAIMGYDAGHGAKPGPGMLLAFADQLGVDAGRLIMIGDSPHDLRAARACGALAVGVSTGKADRGALAPLADHLLDKLDGLWPLLG